MIGFAIRNPQNELYSLELQRGMSGICGSSFLMQIAVIGLDLRDLRGVWIYGWRFCCFLKAIKKYVVD